MSLFGAGAIGRADKAGVAAVRVRGVRATFGFVGRRRFWRLVGVALAVASLLLGLPLTRTAGASPPPDATPAEACANQATGTAGNALKLAVCTDLAQDLSDIGKRLTMTPIMPTTNPLTTPVRVIFNAEDGGNTLLTTHPFASAQSGWEPCEITLFRDAWEKETPQESAVSPRLHVLIAHEVVHCYQYTVAIAFKANLNTDPFPEWISEGSATYLATLYAGYREDNTPGQWKRWIGGSDTLDASKKHNFDETTSLLDRSYDAVGWYSLVNHVNGDPLWSKMAGAWLAYLQSGTAAYIAALGGDSPAVAKAWAPSVLNTPDWGNDWTTFAVPGVEVPSNLRPTEVTGLIAGKDSDTEQIAPLAAMVDDESDQSVFTNALVKISVSDGYASVHDATGSPDIGFQDQLFCFGTACKPCPGAKASLKPIELTAPFVVAAGGGANAATYEIAKIAQPCKRPPAGFSEGDPHLETLDGGDYDFQAAGEFTLVRSDNGDVDVQVRATPSFVPGSVAANTAVAMRLGSTKVEIDAGDPVKILIGGKALPANRITNEAALDKLANEKLRGGGHLALNGPYTIASWPDGSSLNVYADQYGENVIFTPPPLGVDTFSGLLTAWVAPKSGTSAPNPNSETLIGGDGHRYVLDPRTRAGFATLYGPFAKSWRITSKASLFTYPKGKSTSSYVVKGFPLTNAALVDLLAKKKTRATATCKAAGVTDPKLLDGCVLDVAETGHADLATAFSRTIRAEGSATPPAPGNGSLHPVNYYFTHPCQVITPAEITQALGQAYPDNVIPPGGCVIDTNPEDGINFVHESLDQFKAGRPGSVGSGPVNSLGHDAYCIVGPTFTPYQSYVVLNIGSAGILSILADNCADATELAVDALAHVTGL